jgi:guanylate kinase
MSRRKKIIVAIVGESGAGKTELTKYMAAKHDIPYVVSYTTRQMRENEVDGVDHNFVTVKDMPKFDRMIAYTIFGGNHYWVTIDQIEHPVTTYVIDEKGLLKMIDHFSGTYRFFKVYIRRYNKDGIDNERQQRDDDRIIMGDSFYDLVIENNYPTAEEFFEESSKKIIENINHKFHADYK